MTSKPTASRPSVESKDTESPKRTSTPTLDTMSVRSNQFDQIVAGCKELFQEKNAQYKDSIARTGVLGSVVSIAGLSARLEHLVLSASDAGKSQEEAIVDVVKDLINYGVITGIMIMDENWRPE